MNPRLEPLRMMLTALPRRDRAELLQSLADAPAASGGATPDIFLRPSEGAALVGLSTKTLARYEKSGLLPTSRVGSRVVRYRRSDLLRLMAGGRP